MERRSVLKAALGLLSGLGVARRPGAQSVAPRESPPQENDRFVFAGGPRAGEIITPADLPVEGPQVIAFPADPATMLVRDGSRLNQVLLVRVGSRELAEETRARSANGIVAYSAVCTHTGCDVTEWRAGHLLCPCHDSEFDPRDGARVRTGPAPRRLAALPVKMLEGDLVVAASFLGRVGPTQ